jgi:threonine dehydratase
VEVRLTGDTFDAAAEAARAHVAATGSVYVPPFDDPAIIEGQGTIGAEILSDLPDVDAVLLPVGGGGLAAGVGTYIKMLRPDVEVWGVEPEGAPSMTAALEAGGPVTLPSIDRFVDGAAVKRVGDVTFELCRAALSGMTLVPEGAVCSTILQLYQEEAIVVEPAGERGTGEEGGWGEGGGSRQAAMAARTVLPWHGSLPSLSLSHPVTHLTRPPAHTTAGALSVAALAHHRDAIRGRKVVAVVSGSNNDIDRLAEIQERALAHQRLKLYFLISFAQRPGALRDFLNSILGPGDDITRFEYLQRTNKEQGPALVGVEVLRPEDGDALLARMRAAGVDFTEVRRDDKLYGFLL